MPEEKNAYAQKIDELTKYFEEQMADCKAMSQWKTDHRCYRFYFERNDDWVYMLDVSVSDLQEQDATKLIEQLEASAWRQKLAENSGQRIPIFSDGRFCAQFHDWPKKVTYRRR